MKKIKIVIIIYFLLSVSYFYLDCKSYYYGFGKGYISYKLPDYIRPHFRDTDLGNTGFVFVEKDINLNVIDNMYPVDTSNGSLINIKTFLGYGFNKKIIIVKVIDSNDSLRYISVNQTNSGYRFYELLSMQKGLKYINLDHSISYFNKFKVTKNVLLFVLLIYTFILFLKLLKIVNIYTLNKNQIKK